MSNLYDFAREQILGQQLNWQASAISALLVSDAYIFDAAHRNLTSIPTAARIKTAPLPLSGKTISRGIASASRITFPGVIGDGSVVGVVFLRADDGLLIWYGNDGFGFPFRPDGSEVVVSRDENFRGFFQI
jgi:hypothetical protein